MTMTTTTTMLAVGIALASTVLAVGCSDSDARPLALGDAGRTSSGLTTAFSSRCARCHGTTATGQDRYPALPGPTSLTLETFIAVVRSGRKEMPMFDAALISDADLTADFDWMNTKR